MGLEEDFFEAMRYATLGGSMPANKMVQALIVNAQIGALKKLKGELERMIVELSKKKGGTTRSGGEMNPFKILGVEPDDTEEVVKRAYRSKAAEAHPDKGGSHEQMVKVNAAWEAIRRFKGWK
jgi:DnaJ-class molecular chaperone